MIKKQTELLLSLKHYKLTILFLIHTKLFYGLPAWDFECLQKKSRSLQNEEIKPAVEKVTAF